MIERPQKQESKEEIQIMERAREGRLAILSGYMEQAASGLKDIYMNVRQKPGVTSAAAFANYIPFAGPIKMLSEAGVGKTINGRKLTPLGRINHVIIQSLFFESLRLLKDGNYGEASAAYVLSWLFDLLQYASEIVQSHNNLPENSTRRKAIEKLSTLKTFLEKTSKLNHLFFKT
jgi:hypothetical protein